MALRSDIDTHVFPFGHAHNPKFAGSNSALAMKEKPRSGGAFSWVRAAQGPEGRQNELGASSVDSGAVVEAANVRQATKILGRLSAERHVKYREREPDRDEAMGDPPALQAQRSARVVGRAQQCQDVDRENADRGRRPAVRPYPGNDKSLDAGRKRGCAQERDHMQRDHQEARHRHCHVDRADLGAPPRCYHPPPEEQTDRERDRDEDEGSDPQRAAHGRPCVHRRDQVALVLADHQADGTRSTSDEHYRGGKARADQRRDDPDSDQGRMAPVS